MHTGRAMLSAVAIAFAVCACESPEQAQQEEQWTVLEARQSCEARGLLPDTPELAGCVAQRIDYVAELRRRALEDIAPVNRIEPSAGQLCLPTASGLFVGNCS